MALSRRNWRSAKTHELEALAYILDMARLEADQICKRGQDPKPLAKRDEINPELIRGLHFAFGFRLAANLHCHVGAAPSRKRRQRRQGRAGAAVMID